MKLTVVTVKQSTSMNLKDLSKIATVKKIRL